MRSNTMTNLNALAVCDAPLVATVMNELAVTVWLDDGDTVSTSPAAEPD